MNQNWYIDDYVIIIILRFNFLYKIFLLVNVLTVARFSNQYYSEYRLSNIFKVYSKICDFLRVVIK